MENKQKLKKIEKTVSLLSKILDCYKDLEKYKIVDEEYLDKISINSEAWKLVNIYEELMGK